MRRGYSARVSHARGLTVRRRSRAAARGGPRSADGEELDFVFTDVRKKGCRWLIVDGTRVDLAAEPSVDDSAAGDMEAVVDRLVVSRKHEKAIKAAIAATLLVGDGLMQVHVVKGAGRSVSGMYQ